MWRPLHEGQTPRPLHENATTTPWPQSVQRARPKPKQRMPHSRDRQSGQALFVSVPFAVGRVGPSGAQTRRRGPGDTARLRTPPPCPRLATGSAATQRSDGWQDQTAIFRVHPGQRRCLESRIESAANPNVNGSAAPCRSTADPAKARRYGRWCRGTPSTPSPRAEPEGESAA